MSKPDLAKLAGEIVESYISSETPPTESLMKISERENLPEEWIRRLAETVNVSLHSTIQEKVGSSMIQFSLADAGEVISKMASKDGVEKKAMALSIADQATGLQRGIAMDAAEEWMDKINRRIGDGGMAKVASINDYKPPMSTHKKLEIKKIAETTRGKVDGMLIVTTKNIEIGLSKLATIVRKAMVQNGDEQAIDHLKSAAINSFPNDRELVSAVVGMVAERAGIKKLASDHDASAEMDESSEAFRIIDGIVGGCKFANGLQKIAGSIKDENIVRMVDSEDEGKAVLQKVALIGGAIKSLGGLIIKHPMSSGMGALGVALTVPEVKKKFRKDVIGDGATGLPLQPTGEANA